MVNERDEHGWTLLHLIAAGDRVPNGYQLALELVRHGGRRGVDWDAVTDEGMTARQLADKAWQREDLDERAHYLTHDAMTILPRLQATWVLM